MKKTPLSTLLLAALALVLSAGPGITAELKDLSAQEVKDLMASGQSAVVINPLSDIEFNENHIPGTVNIPLHNLAGSDLLPADKATPIVTYCLGPK
jgi:rhodanese-related sulfurtransferase